MTTHQAVLFLFDLTVVLVLAHGCGFVVRSFGQPRVIGEIIAGILLGPTLFGGAITRTLFPADVRPFFAALANLGVVMFMFALGLEFDRRLLKGGQRAAGVVAVGSIVLPMGLGVCLALHLVQSHPAANTAAFALFLGAAMSVTAFPVLARILTGQELHRTGLGGLALACAAMDDVIAWSLLAMVVVVAGAGDGGQWLLLLLPVYLALMASVVRPALQRVIAGPGLRGRPTTRATVALLSGALLSAAFTEWIGLHFIFGAFLFGVMVPREGTELLREHVAEGMGRIGNTVLMPVFFLVAGLKVDLSGVGRSAVGELLLILLVAVGGKFGGAYLGARLAGVEPREAAGVAALMNTRGLTELVILSVGLELGVLDTRLYSLMVVMAVVTTAMTGPMLAVIRPGPSPRWGGKKTTTQQAVEQAEL